MQREKLNYVETAERFQQRHKRVQDWVRIYLTYGAMNSVWSAAGMTANVTRPNWRSR